MSNWINGNLVGKLSVGQGDRGKSLEYMWRGTELGIRVEGEEEYQFVNLAGGSAREIELQVNNGYIQWRYVGEESWNNLIALSILEGQQGPKGDKGEQGLTGPQGPKGEKGEQGLQGLPGKDGKNGLDGTNGINGQDGANGKDGITPDITIGTVTTLEAGQQATVTREGTKENPIFNFGIPKGNVGDTGEKGETPDMSDFENKINKQYGIIKAKVDKIEHEDTPVEIPIVGNTLTLTTNKRQKTTMKNNTTIVLPVVDKFTEIHLKFNTTETLTLTLPKIKWQGDINIEANKTYEFIFTHDDEWMGGVVVYK